MYLCPGYIAPALQVIAERRRFDERLAHPVPWTPEMARHLDVKDAAVDGAVFIWPAGLPAQMTSACYEEFAAVGRMLEARGYTRHVIQSYGAAAGLFQRGSNPSN